jgi:hypothetical protein
MTYMGELEELWKTNRRRKPTVVGPERARSLRGPDFVGELHRLWVLTKDERFKDAIRALAQYDIIDQDGNFLRWMPPSLAKLQGDLEETYVEAVHTLMINCECSRHRACAEMAARSGLEATSFKAAIKHLDLLYSAYLKASVPRCERGRRAVVESKVGKIV